MFLVTHCFKKTKPTPSRNIARSENYCDLPFPLVLVSSSLTFVVILLFTSGPFALVVLVVVAVPDAVPELLDAGAERRFRKCWTSSMSSWSMIMSAEPSMTSRLMIAGPLSEWYPCRRANEGPTKTQQISARQTKAFSSAILVLLKSSSRRDSRRTLRNKDQNLISLPDTPFLQGTARHRPQTLTVSPLKTQSRIRRKFNRSGRFELASTRAAQQTTPLLVNINATTKEHFTTSYDGDDDVVKKHRRKVVDSQQNITFLGGRERAAWRRTNPPDPGWMANRKPEKNNISSEANRDSL